MSIVLIFSIYAINRTTVLLSIVVAGKYIVCHGILLYYIILNSSKHERYGFTKYNALIIQFLFACFVLFWKWRAIVYKQDNLSNGSTSIQFSVMVQNDN